MASRQLSRAALITAVVAAAACKPKPAPVPTLLVITELKGVTEPCGCTSRPLGGLDRLATKLAPAHGSPSTALLVAGDTFFQQTTIPEHLAPQEERRSAVVASVLG